MPPLFLRILLVFSFLISLGNVTAFANSNDSAVVIYHANGKIKEKGSYHNGELHGRWYVYDEDGKLQKLTRYKNGYMRWQKLYKDGVVIQTTDSKGRVRKKKDCGC